MKDLLSQNYWRGGSLSSCLTHHRLPRRVTANSGGAQSRHVPPRFGEPAPLIARAPPRCSSLDEFEFGIWASTLMSCMLPPNRRCSNNSHVFSLMVVARMSETCPTIFCLFLFNDFVWSMYDGEFICPLCCVCELRCILWLFVYFYGCLVWLNFIYEFELWLLQISVMIC